MKIKIIWIATALLTICIGVLWAANDVNNPKNITDSSQRTLIYGKETLRGLQGVYVLIENMTTDAEKNGLTTQQLQTDVELKLRQNGIKVLSQSELHSTDGNPYLYVMVNYQIRNDIAIFSISLELHQEILLVRDSTKDCLATTWHKGATGGAGINNIQFIREHVKDLVDMFINDYLAVNPK
jgi:hypothetical protein